MVVPFVGIGGRSQLLNFISNRLLNSRMATLLEDYQNRIYSINLTVAENWGVIQGNAEKKGKPMSSLDSLIAAIAYTHNLIIVTRNVRYFEASSLPIRNPWMT